MFPFEFRATSVLERISAGVWHNAAPPQGEVVHNLLLFVVPGALLHSRWKRRYNGWQTVALVCAVGLLVSLAVEWQQLFLPRRHPTIVDVLSNTAGAWAGAITERGWGARVEAQLGPLARS